MKKSHIVLAVLALAALVSCQQGSEIDYVPLEKGEVGFYLNGTRLTKSDNQVVPVRGETFELGSNENGVSFLLEETITDINLNAPETKGTPAYTENVLALYEGAFGATLEGKNGVIETGGQFKYDSEKKMYVRKYTGSIWDNKPLTFYMWMPSGLNSAVTNGISGLTCSDETIAFDYDGTKLTTADIMQDLLFSSRTFTGLGTGENEYDEENGADILFHHALTGVKFAVDATAGISITNVAIKGISDKAHCVITPRPEDQPAEEGEEATSAYIDNPTGDYSSGDDLTVVWSGWNNPSTNVYSLGKNYTGSVVDYSKPESGTAPFPNSFYNAGADDNLNDSDATFTFWFIPQTITDNLTFTITYTDVNVTKPITWEISVGEILAAKNVVWKAGQLRTYTIRIDDVNVMIDDTIDMDGDADDCYEGSIKSEVVIKNTGNTDAFIRAAIVGQWLTEEGDPVFGFTDAIFELQAVDSWYQDQFVTISPATKPERKQGLFVGLAGYDQGVTWRNWYYNSTDGYYYYTKYVEPQKATGETGTDSAGKPIHDPIFDTYTIGEAPDSRLADIEETIHFELEIATQAVSAKKLDGSHYTWREAWAKALGYDPIDGPSE